MVSLTASAIELFTVDGLELSLALTASDADESSTVTVRFASSARGFDGAALRELIHDDSIAIGDGGVRGGGCESYDLAQQRRRRGIQFGGRWIGVVYGGIGRRGVVGVVSWKWDRARVTP